MGNRMELQMSDSNSVPLTKIFSFKGDLDSTNATSTLNTIKEMLEGGFINIIADFQYLRYLNSMGLGILIHLTKIAKEKSGCFHIVRINNNVMEIIELIGADSILDIYHTLEDSLAIISKEMD